MDISNKIKQAKNDILERSIKSKKISKTLSLIRDDIVDLAKSGITIEEQCEVLSSALDMPINTETYKSYYYRNIKKYIDNDLVTIYEKSKSKSTPTIVKKVAPLESNKYKSVAEIFATDNSEKSEYEDLI